MFNKLYKMKIITKIILTISFILVSLGMIIKISKSNIKQINYQIKVDENTYYWVTEYKEVNNCIEFVDEFKDSVKVCENYKVSKF